MTCQHCQCAEKLFNHKGAQKEKRKYLKKGPRVVTRKLIKALLPQVKSGDSLLDIGGGIGAIQLAVLKAGAAKATGVDASGGYLEVAKELSAKQGYADRINYLHGDFLDEVNSLERHDIVTLDKVICCYPDYEALLKAATEKAQKTLVLAFPRDILPVKMLMSLANLWFRFRGSAFRTYAHSSEDVFKLIKDQGFERVANDRHRAWQIVVFNRNQPTA